MFLHTAKVYSIFWWLEPKRACSAEQGMVFRVLSLEQGIPFHFLASWTGCLFGLEAFKKVWMLAMSGLHLWYRDFFPKCIKPCVSFKKYIIPKAKLNEPGSWNKPSTSGSSFLPGTEMGDGTTSPVCGTTLFLKRRSGRGADPRASQQWFNLSTLCAGHNTCRRKSEQDFSWGSKLYSFTSLSGF